MDNKERQIRQREFTIYLVLFILLVIVGAITTNGQAIDGRRYESQYGNPYYHGGYAGSPYGNYYSGYNEYGMTPSYAWNQLHGYGNGPPFNPNANLMYGQQGYGQVHPVYGQQGVHPGWGYHGGAQGHPSYGYPPVGFNNSYYGPPAPPMMPSHPFFWGNDPRRMGPNHPFQPMREQANFMGPYNTTPYAEGYGHPFYPQMQQPYNQVWW